MFQKLICPLQTHAYWLCLLRNQNWGYICVPMPQVSKTSFPRWSWKTSASFCFANWVRVMVLIFFVWVNIRNSQWMCRWGLVYTREAHCAKSSTFPWACVATVCPRAADVQRRHWMPLGLQFPPCEIAALSQLAECRHRHRCRVLAQRVSRHRFRPPVLLQEQPEPAAAGSVRAQVHSTVTAAWVRPSWSAGGGWSGGEAKQEPTCLVLASVGWLRGGSIQRSRRCLETKLSSIKQWVYFKNSWNQP